MAVIELGDYLFIEQRCKCGDIDGTGAAAQRNGLQSVGGIAMSNIRQAKPGECVFEQGNDGNRIAGPQHRFQHQHQQRALRRRRKRCTRRIVGLDTKPGQF